ncbi:hypothetical protein ACJJTC_014498 [Scirpophaga incertulas]
MKGEYDIKICDNAVPIIHACRKVPLAIQSRLKDKLDEMEKQNIIVRVTHPTKWKYNFGLVYKRGKELYIADTLTRSFDSNDCVEIQLDSDEIEAQIMYVVRNINATQSKLEKIKEMTAKDDDLTVLIKIGKHWRNGEVLSRLDKRTYKIGCNGATYIRNRILIKPLAFVPFYICNDDVNVSNNIHDSPPLQNADGGLLNRNSEGYFVTSSGRVSRPPNRYGFS